MPTIPDIIVLMSSVRAVLWVEEALLLPVKGEGGANWVLKTTTVCGDSLVDSGVGAGVVVGMMRAEAVEEVVEEVDEVLDELLELLDCEAGMDD